MCVRACVRACARAVVAKTNVTISDNFQCFKLKFRLHSRIMHYVAYLNLIKRWNKEEMTSNRDDCTRARIFVFGHHVPGVIRHKHDNYNYDSHQTS